MSWLQSPLSLRRMFQETITERQIFSTCDQVSFIFMLFFCKFFFIVHLSKREIIYLVQVYQCRLCCKIIRRTECSPELHRCGTTKCPSCGTYVNAAEHWFFLRVIPSQKPSDKLIYFDFKRDQSSGEHIVNLTVAQYVDGGENIFKGYKACEDFCCEDKGFTAVAHHMKG